MEYPQSAVHRTIVVVDVEGFGDRRRTMPYQLAVREGLYRALRQALGKAGVRWTECYHEDRGDGVLVLAPAEMPKSVFVDSVPAALVAALREHNTTRSAHQERIRLRMALHAGEVAYDKYGVTAGSVTLAFRLLDAPVVKAALAESPGMLALIVSGWFFDEVVRQNPAADAATFRPVRVAIKETSTVGWICLPDHPYSPDPAQLTALPPESSTGQVPHQLPAAPRAFAGRAEELATLTVALQDRASRGEPVVISAIAGTGGIGKTWLALHWAHQHADRFPDGQLFVDLRGFSSAGEPMTATSAVRGFLDALGVEPTRLPVELDAQVALYRSLMAGRRMLIVLDNARTIDQVVPLLPGSPTCTVLITSRDRLTGLTASHGARPLPLDVLSETEARELLARYLGPQRVDAEPDAVTELLAYCAGLPLAISIVAARAVTYQNFPLAVLAEELREASTRLDTFDGGDLIVNLRAVFSWSYRAVDTDTAMVFRLLGLAPGPEISLSAVASLAGLPVSRTRVLLRELENAHLVQQHLPWRYRLHDLIQLYATERAGQDHPEHDRTAALRRLIDFYVHTAHCGDRLLDPHRRPITLDQPVIGCAPDPLPDAATALAWFDAEHHCLLAAQQCAERQGWYAQVWQLAWVLATFHQRRGHLHDDVAVWRLGLAAAEKLDESSLQVWAHRYLGQALIRVGRHTDAGDHLRQARAGAEQIGDVLCQVHVQCVLAWALHGQGDDQQALTHATRALRLCQTLKVPAWEAFTLNLAGWLHARLGHYQQARTYCELALALQRHHHDREGEASTLDSLGYIARHTNRPSDAISYYHQALDVARDLGYRYAEADTLAHLGQTHATLGRLTDARHAWHQALKLYQAQHRTNEAERVQQQLDALNPHTTTDTPAPTNEDGERGARIERRLCRSGVAMSDDLV